MAVPSQRIAGQELFRPYLQRFMGHNRLYPLFEPLTPGMDDFEDKMMGQTINIAYNVGNGGGASAASPVVASDLTYGAIRFVTGGASGTTASSDLSLGRFFTAERSCAMVAAIRISSVADMKIEIGFTDVLQGTDTGAVNSLASNTARADDAAVWIVDTADNAEWQAWSVDSTTVATKIEDGGTNQLPTLVADTVNFMMVELYEDDSSANTSVARFRRFNADGELTYTSGWMAGPTSTVALCPMVYVQDGGATRTMDMTYFRAWGRRTE